MTFHACMVELRDMLTTDNEPGFSTVHTSHTIALFAIQHRLGGTDAARQLASKTAQKVTLALMTVACKSPVDCGTHVLLTCVTELAPLADPALAIQFSHIRAILAHASHTDTAVRAALAAIRTETSAVGASLRLIGIKLMAAATNSLASIDMTVAVTTRIEALRASVKSLVLAAPSTPSYIEAVRELASVHHVATPSEKDLVASIAVDLGAQMVELCTCLERHMIEFVIASASPQADTGVLRRERHQVESYASSITDAAGLRGVSACWDSQCVDRLKTCGSFIAAIGGCTGFVAMVDEFHTHVTTLSAAAGQSLDFEMAKIATTSVTFETLCAKHTDCEQLRVIYTSKLHVFTEDIQIRIAPALQFWERHWATWALRRMNSEP